MKRFFVTALMTGVPFGLCMGLFYSGRGGALAMGIANGVAFGLAMGGFMAWQHKRSAKLLAHYESEGLVHHGPANYGAAGGWLVLTKQRLLFEPHKLNLGLGKRVEVPAAEIGGARPGDGAIPNKIAVVTRGNQTLQFVVRSRAEWLEKLPGVKPS
jgi:hypothetical protein